jgi:hypothetical protein
MKCTIHTIKKGKHRTNKPRLGLHYNKRTLSYNVTFYESCLYKTELSSNQKDINKLFGLSFGLHHKNSARFGWRSTNDDCIEVLAYVYRDGVRINEWDEPIYIDRIDINKEYTFELTLSDSYYTFMVKDGDDIVGASLIKSGKLFPIGYYLNPYFGGDEKAQHNMKISLCRE